MNSRNRTPSQFIGYGPYLYFPGLSFGNTAKALSFLHVVNISHVSIWKWMQKHKPKKAPSKKKNISECVIDETAIGAGSECIWLWIAVEPKDKETLAISISKERNMFVAGRFLSNAAEKYGHYPVSTDGGTWYPQACKLLKLEHHIHPSHEKSPIERTMQYVKDRTEGFDDYLPCKKLGCKL